MLYRLKYYLFVLFFMNCISYCFSDMLELFVDYKKSQLSVTEPDEIQAWIDRFEAELKQNQSHPLLGDVKISLTELYAKQSNYNITAVLLTEVRDDVNISNDTRLQAAYKLAMLYQESLDLDVDIYQSAFEEYDALVSGFEKSNAQFDRYHLFQQSTLDAKKGEFYLAKAKQEQNNELKEECLKKSIHCYKAYYDKINSNELPIVMRNHLDSLYLNSHEFLIKLATAQYEFSEFLQENDSKDQAKIIRHDTAQLVKEFIDKYPQTYLTQHAACLLLNCTIRDLKYDEMELLLNDICPKIIKGHTFILFLRSLGMNMSLNEAKLVTANLMFDTVTKMEKEWFPNEYMEHSSYIVTLLTKSQNLITLGDLAPAKRIIDELKTLNLKLDIYIDDLDALEEYYDRKFKNLVVDPEIENIELAKMKMETPATKEILEPRQKESTALNKSQDDISLNTNNEDEKSHDGGYRNAKYVIMFLLIIGVTILGLYLFKGFKGRK